MSHALLITFQVLTLENWNTVQYLALNTTNNKYLTIIYLYVWIFVGNYVLLNLFLAVLIEGFYKIGTDQIHLEWDDFQPMETTTLVSQLKNEE
jgi:hypothetical protein